MDEWIKVLIYKENNIPIIFLQHGSYIYQGYASKYSEALLGDVFFVFNENTKDYFSKITSSKIYITGSKFFNKPIENYKYYDYLYIVRSLDLLNVNIINCTNLIDLNKLFKDTLKVISIFTKFPEKKFLIKLNPNMLISSLYLPLIEIFEQYQNISIDVTTPMIDLINKSNNIFADYFSSDFTNLDLHFKKNIFIFNCKTFCLPQNELLKIKRIFRIISIDDVENIIKNSDKFKRIDKKYQKDIEYFTSKKIEEPIKNMKTILEEEFKVYKFI
jgi:hypothetical protein